MTQRRSERQQGARRDESRVGASVAVGYVRVSTEEQSREGVSLDAQTDRLQAYCKLRGLTLSAIYRDEGVSAGKPLVTRPQGAAILQRVGRGEVRNVVALKLDRLFRNAIDCLQTVSTWDEAGVALHLIDIGGQAVDTSSAMGRFFLTVMAGAAEMERNLVRERTRTAMAYKRAQGGRVGGPSPLGFVTVERGEAMEPQADEMAVVRFILNRRRHAHASFRAIATELAEAGYKTKQGGQWHASTVHGIWTRRKLYEPFLSGVAV